jgi:hypothetical protein
MNSLSEVIGFLMVFVGIPLVGYLMAASVEHQREVYDDWDISRYRNDE